MFRLLGWKPRGCEVEKTCGEEHVQATYRLSNEQISWLLRVYTVREYTTQLCGDYTKLNH